MIQFIITTILIFLMGVLLVSQTIYNQASRCHSIGLSLEDCSKANHWKIEND